MPSAREQHNQTTLKPGEQPQLKLTLPCSWISRRKPPGQGLKLTVYAAAACAAWVLSITAGTVSVPETGSG